MFKILDSIDKELWSEFVAKNPYGNIFQTPEMASVYEKTKRIEPVTLFALDSDEIIASLVAYISTEKEGILKPLATRAVIQGGPLFLNNKKGLNALPLLMKHYDSIVQKKAIFTEIRMMFDIPEFSALNGYLHEDHLNFLVNLNKPKEELWKNLSKSRRRFIKKSRDSVTIEEAKDLPQVKQFYNLLRETYKNAKLPLADISLFKSAFQVLKPKGMLKIFLAKYKEEYIGGIMTPIYKDRIYEWYITSSKKHSKLYPGYLLTWHPIEWGSEDNYKIFDLGGAGKPNEKYGVRNFKSQFGGSEVNLGRYRKVYSPAKMEIAKGGFEVYREVFI